MIKFVYKVLPVFIIFCKHLPRLSDDYSGYNLGPIVLIKEQQKENLPLIEHELVHTRQFYRTLGLHIPLYMIFKEYRLVAEIEAVAKQITFYPDESLQFNLEAGAHFIYENYDLKDMFSLFEIKDRLMQKYKEIKGK